MKPNLISLFLFGVVSMACGQEVRFFIKTSSDTLLAGHLLQVTYVLENAELRQFEPPDFQPLRIVSGPQQSSSMRIINGRASSEASVTYLLLAEHSGEYTIPPAQVKLKDKILECQRRHILVQPNPGELPDPRFPGWRPSEIPPPPGDTLRQKLRKDRKVYRL